jgi:AhpD family alkylhydroperoxidase
MTIWPQYEVFANARGRIQCMDSVGYVDARNDVTDVLVCGSHGAPCATQLAVWARPRGLFCHDAGIGKEDGGVAGLRLLQEYLIPGAMVDGASAQISDGRDMYENGVLSRVNGAAERMGLHPRMPTKDAAMHLLKESPVPDPPVKRQLLLASGPQGCVFGLDTVKYADRRIEGGVLCMGSHAARAMADYVDDLGFRLAGVITNDAGIGKNGAGIAGLSALDAIDTPAAAVSCKSARVGSARSTYSAGIVSACNATAEAAGVCVGMAATEAAARMLACAGGVRALDATVEPRPDWRAVLAQVTPEAVDNAARTAAQIMAREGALPRKMKELIALAAAARDQRSDDVRAHAIEAMYHGASDREVVESLTLAARGDDEVVLAAGIEAVADQLTLTPV